MARLLLLALALIMLASSLAAQPPGRRFAAIAFHDVVDRREELGPDAVTTDQLVRFFDWLKGNGWTVVSLDEVAAAGQGAAPLPDQSILLTFDDGYHSLYTRVFPLLQAYRYRAVAALVGSWMDGTGEGTVDYGGAQVPRGNFVSWAEAREMQASGLVEFASHSYALHKGILANPQGNLIAAARTWRYDPEAGRYETDLQYRQRIRQDFEHSRRQMAAELGRPPRALVWPFGRASGPALEEAVTSGFRFAFDLDARPGDAGRPMTIGRYFPTLNPTLGEIATNLRFEPDRPESVRVACVSLEGLAVTSGAAQDSALGRMLEDLRALGANKVILDGRAASGALLFPAPGQPMQADLLSRAVWQIHSRAAAEVYVRLPAETMNSAAGPALFGEMLRHAVADGIVIDAPAIAGSQAPQLKGDVQAVRAALEPAPVDRRLQPLLQAYRAAARIDPQLRLMLAEPGLQGPPAWADYVLDSPANDVTGIIDQATQLRASGWLRPDLAGRIILTLPASPQVQTEAMRSAQRLGVTGFALCPKASLPPTKPLAATFSGASFPYRP